MVVAALAARRTRRSRPRRGHAVTVGPRQETTQSAAPATDADEEQIVTTPRQ